MEKETAINEENIYSALKHQLDNMPEVNNYTALVIPKEGCSQEINYFSDKDQAKVCSKIMGEQDAIVFEDVESNAVHVFNTRELISIHIKPI